MIETARQALSAAGVLDARYPAQVAVTAGRAINVLVFPQGSRNFYNVKLSRMSLEREYRALLELAPVLVVPTACALVQVGGIEALITKGAQFKHIRSITAPLAEFVQRYHSTQLQSRAFGLEAEANHREFLERISHPKGFNWAGWLSSGVVDFLDGLPAVKQHGDFLPMNMGRAPGRYVIFDWEDFGVVTLPGFDLVTFLLDVYGFDATGLQKLLNSQDALIASLRHHLLQTLDLTDEQFVPFVLVSLLIFFHIKVSMRYGTPIITDASRMIELLLTRYRVKLGLL